jgi:hypothetical protein
MNSVSPERLAKFQPQPFGFRLACIMHVPWNLCFAHATTMVLNEMMMDRYQVCYNLNFSVVFLLWRFVFFFFYGMDSAATQSMRGYEQPHPTITQHYYE